MVKVTAVACSGTQELVMSGAGPALGGGANGSIATGRIAIETVSTGHCFNKCAIAQLLFR